ncbi:MAG TPA: hypothetical protein EYM84_04015 [Flavobacteriales bacterium]|nr:hypothetical protein [Flavobacteriales bacterium]HIN39418.1 hypothetical protein [Flavobacteriales bacterium]
MTAYWILLPSHGGAIYTFDGNNYSIMWQVNIPGTESSAEPSIGNFTGSYLEPDVFNVVY